MNIVLMLVNQGVGNNQMCLPVADGPLCGHSVGIDQHPHGGVGDSPNNVGKDDKADNLDPYAKQ